MKTILNEQDIHIHNYPTNNGLSQNDSGSNNDTPTDNSTDNYGSNPAPLNDKLNINQNLMDNQVSKFMANKNNEQKPLDVKEVFIRNHIRRYQRKPSIGMLKNEFGSYS